MKRVLIAFPTQWDQRHLDACKDAWQQDYVIEMAEPDDESCPWDFDVPTWIGQSVERYRGKIDGVFSSSDYPGAAAAAAIAHDLGLPGTPPDCILAAAHKYYARLAQHAAAPEAVPEFCLVDPATPHASPTIGFPCFVKPVKAAFSVMARRIEDQPALTSLLESPEVAHFMDTYVHIFDQLCQARSQLDIDARRFIAETPLSGFQVTVEGYRHRGQTHILGVVDSVMYPDTRSFARFDYPSFLGPQVQQRMGDIAGRVAAALGLEQALFNVEMFYDPSQDRIWIIEINPRLCGQFADLYQKVDGVNTYEIALALATGEEPPQKFREGPCACASSFPLRVFEPGVFVACPDSATIAEVQAHWPGTQVWVEYEQGDRIEEFASTEDGYSARYAIVNAGAENREALAERVEGIVGALGFRYETG